MEYTYLENHIAIRKEFLRRFTMPYGAFCESHAQWFANLPPFYRAQYTQAYFLRLPYSDRLSPEFSPVSFEEALDQLRRMPEAYFLTCEPGGVMCDYAVFGTGHLWAARTTGPELADAIREEWFETYALWEQDLNNPDPLFASEIYAFTPDYTQAVIFTHETDETEQPETRICLRLTRTVDLACEK